VPVRREAVACGRTVASLGEHVPQDSSGRRPEQQEGADESDSIWVSIDSTGRVVGVDISGGWRDRMGHTAFPGALVAAYNDAVRRLVDASVVATLSAEEQAGRRPFESRPDSQDPQAAPAPPVAERPMDQDDWLASIGRLLHDIDEELRQVGRTMTEVAVRNRGETALSSPYGYFTAQLSGSVISAITGDIQRIRVASNEQLRLEALALFHAVAEATEH
jgi:hypothetical protein